MNPDGTSVVTPVQRSSMTVQLPQQSASFSGAAPTVGSLYTSTVVYVRLFVVTAEENCVCLKAKSTKSAIRPTKLLR